MNFPEWISLYQIINFIMDCIWLYAISWGVFLTSSYIYTFKVFMYIIPQFRPFDPYGSVAKSQSSCSFWRRSQLFRFFWKYFFGHLPICASFTNDNTLHLYKSFIFRIFKFLCNTLIGVSLSNAKSNFNSLFCIVCILFTFLSEQFPYISMPCLVRENTNAK